MPDVALWDLVAPYWLLGNSAGNFHAAFAALAVDTYDQASDGTSTVIRGRANFHGEVSAFIDPSTLSFGVRAANTEGHLLDDPNRREPWIDLRDTAVDFQIVADRVGSNVVALGHGPIDNPPGGDPFEPIDDVLDALDVLPVDLPISDYPSTDFTLEMVLTSAVLRPPFLQPATMRADGRLEPHATKKSVALTLPKIKVSVTQNATTGNAPVLRLESLGAAGIDDTGDIGVAQLVKMDPPYAFIGSGRVVGFGFRSAVLDLSDRTTPPDILDQFGFDPSWTGVYFPEIRLFVAPQGMEGLAVNAGVRNLLVGIGEHSGVTGDFELDVINQGGGPLDLSVRFTLPDGSQVGFTPTGDGTGEATLPAISTMVVDVGGRRPPYTVETSVDDGASFQPGAAVAIDLSTDATRTIVARASTPDDSTPATLTITARRRDTSGGAGTAPPPPSIPEAEVTETSTTRGGNPVDGPRLVIDRQTNDTATLRLEDRTPANWSVDGVDQPGLPTVLLTVPLAPGESKQVVATGEATSTHAPIYFHYDEPDQRTDAQLVEYAQIAALTSTAPSADETITSGFPGGQPVLISSEHREALRSLSPSTAITVVGHASWEGPYADAAEEASKETYNLHLSERRAKVAEWLYDHIAGGGVLDIDRNPRSFLDAKPAQQANPTDNPRRVWWRAELASAIPVPGPVTTGTVERDPVDTPPDPNPAPVDPPPADPTRPDFFRSIGAKVRIVRDDFVAVELHGEVDFQTAAEDALDGQQVGGQPAETPDLVGLGQNPADGIVAFRGVFTIDPGNDHWGLNLMFGADPADVDGLLMTGSLPGQAVQPRNTGRNLLGMYALFYPLLAEVAPEKPATAEVEDLVLAGAVAAVPGVLAAIPWFNVQRVVWYGADVVVRQHEGEWSTAILLDIETAVSGAIGLGDLTLLTISDEVPLVARYKAIGLRVGVDVDGELILHPVFDSSKGFTLDLARPGSITMADPLDRLLKVIGARISKTNPTFFEIELGSAVDLGVVALDRVGVRVELADPVDVELTSLGASIDIPGALTGSGYFRFSDTGFAGRIDLTLVPLRLRIAASLRVEEITEGDRTATAVAISLLVEFPVAIPLYASGLGIYGFIGLFAMHFTRNEDPEITSGSTTVALDWLRRAGGDPTRVEDDSLWKPTIDNWAFGLGMIVGTMGSPIVFNMKGIVLLELPGPRILLMMKANVIFPIPELEGDAEGNFLAVVDIDAGRRTLTIGITIDFTIEPLLQLRIPIEAFFDGKKSKNWHVFVGSYPDPIRAKVFATFEGSGYLMLLGDGAKEPSKLAPMLPRPSGFAISAGLQVSMLWGAKEVRLYAELAAGFDAVLGFSPLLVAGQIRARGEMRLFIIFLSAQATLDVRLGELPGSDPPDSGYEIHGEVCAKLDLFFFSIKGCVDFTLKDDEVPSITIPDVVDGVSMIARSPALIHGTATDEPVDGAFGNAILGDEPNWASLPADPSDDDEAQAAMRQVADVPINVIPVALFSAPPVVENAEPSVDEVTFLGDPVSEASGGRPVSRSTDTITYKLNDIDLVGPISAGNTPTAWWTLHPPTDDNETAQLALLSWVPNPWPKALQRSDELTQTVVDRWGTVCHEAAPATPVLWTFRFEPIGPSATGWDVDGIAWPDPPDTQRSTPTPTDMHVRDRWRCGDEFADDYRGILPAVVTGALVFCPQGDDGDKPDDPGPTLPPPVLGDDIIAPGRLPGVDVPDIPGVGVVAPADLVPGTGIERARTRRQAATAGEMTVGVKETERLVDGPDSLDELVRRLAIGEPVSRSAFTRVSVAKAAATAPKCESRVLASPRFDTLQPPQGDPELEADVQQIWEETGFEPGDLHDAVVLEPNCFVSGRLLLFVPDRLLQAEELIVRTLDEGGGIVEEIVVEFGHVIAPATLPAPWIDPAGPWLDDVFLAAQHFATLGALDSGLQLVLVDLEPGEAERIVIGLTDGDIDTDLVVNPYFVAVVETLSCAEIAREDSDSHIASENHDMLEAAFDASSGNVALLEPGTSYQVRVTWSAEASNAEGETASVSEEREEFWFRTAADPPESLDPWILTTTPTEGERHVFGGEPLQLAFASHDVLDVFAAYGTRLEVRISAASSLHPEPDDPTIDHPMVLDPTNTVPIAGAVLTPWEDTVGQVVDPECVEIDDERIRHLVTTIPIPLRPATDYLLDVDRVPLDAPEGTAGDRIFRRSFSTSAFDTLADAAAWIMGSRVRHRAVPDGLAGAIGSAFAGHDPQGAELDTVMQGTGGQEGIEPLPVPTQPAVEVWWEAGGGTPRPVAVVIDGTEPLWREREVPTLVPIPDTSMTHWEVDRQPWVEPSIAADSDPVVSQIIRAPGGQRAVVVLTPGARGQRLRMDLLRRAFDEDYLDGAGATDEREPIVDVALHRAPWEEV